MFSDNSNSKEIKWVDGSTVTKSHTDPYFTPQQNVQWYSWPTRCSYCDGFACKKPERCPRVKSVNYFKDGSISKIEFHKMEK